MNKADWLNLVAKADWATVDDRWMAAIEDPSQDRDALVSVLSAMASKGQAERAATMAWLWLGTLKDRDGAAATLALAREILPTAESAQLRGLVADLYKDVYADRPEIGKLLEVSGLTGGRTPRRAFRTLEICLRVVPGSFVISRTEDKPAEVIEADAAAGRFVIRAGTRRIELDADQLGVDYDPADPNDYRVLTALQPERFRELLVKEPAEIVISMLRAKGGKLDSDELKYALTPQHMAPEAWSKWWSRLRTELKRHPNVRMEGRNPVVLVFDEKGQSLDEEIRGKWTEARTPEDKLVVVELYAREAKARKVSLDGAMLKQWGTLAADKVRKHPHEPVEAMRWAVVADKLQQLEPGATPTPALVKSTLLQAANPVALLRDFLESSLIHSLLDDVRVEMPDRWEQIFLELFPVSPPDVCEVLAGHLIDAGHADWIQSLVQQIASRPQDSLYVMWWLWRGSPCAAKMNCPPKLELMTRMLTLLGDLSRGGEGSIGLFKDAKLILKAALSVRKYEVFREVMSGINLDMARTIHRQIERAPGLSQALIHDLTRVTREIFHDLFVEKRFDPWADPNLIYTTEEGLQKAEKELAELVNVKMVENAKAIGAAAALGDLSENSEYKFALEERDLLRARVSMLQNEINAARPLKPHLIPRDVVTVGTKVKIRAMDGSAEHEMVFLGPWDSDVARHVYNYQAPLSQKLMGLTLGDTVELTLDEAPIRQYRIESILPAI